MLDPLIFGLVQNDFPDDHEKKFFKQGKWIVI
jgi:hypothetical protein